MAIREIAENHGSRWNTVRACINSLKLPKKYQEAVWSGPLSLRHIEMVESLFNSTTVESILGYLDDAIERKLTHIQLAEIVDPVKAQIKKQQIEAAKKEAKTIKPKIQIKIETPEDYEKAAEALKEEAKKKREAEIAKLTPKEKIKLEAQKQKEREEKDRKAEQKRQEEEIRLQEKAEEIAKSKLMSDKKFRKEVKGDLSKSDVEALEKLKDDPVLTSEDKKVIRELIEKGEIRGKKQFEDTIGLYRKERTKHQTVIRNPEKEKEFKGHLKKITKTAVSLSNLIRALAVQFTNYPETLRDLPSAETSQASLALTSLGLTIVEFKKTCENASKNRKDQKKLKEG